MAPNQIASAIISLQTQPNNSAIRSA